MPESTELDPGRPPALPSSKTLSVSLRPAEVPITKEVAFWQLIQDASKKIGFRAYEDHIARRCEEGTKPLKGGRGFNLPFFKVDAYERLKTVTDEFLRSHVGVLGPRGEQPSDDRYWDLLAEQASAQLGREVTREYLEYAWSQYLDPAVGANGKQDDVSKVIPYFDRLRAKFPELGVSSREDAELCELILQDRLQKPCLIELIWSYWMEEAMLVQVLNAISLRFQNRHVGPERAVLAHLDVNPLRPLNNLLWGYVQDEQHRLSIIRRAYEYDHAYGLRMVGRAVGERLQPADSRSQFLEAFHRLLQLASRFFQQDDDTTVRADGFPLLNALKEVNIVLGEGGGNQYGDLPWVARAEMLMQQWLLARPEMREFFSSRSAVIYPETWMERLDSARSVLGIPGPSVLHFYNLAHMGERVLLSIRYHPWTDVNDTPTAANWARSFRSDIQGYIHAYHAVTGVDLSAAAVSDRIDARLPSVLISERLALLARR